MPPPELSRCFDGRGKPAASSTLPCSATKSGAAMTGGTLCRLGGEVAGVGRSLPLFARLGVTRGRGAVLAQLCSLPYGVYFVHAGEISSPSMRFPVTEREGGTATAPKGLIPGGLTKGSLL